LTVDTKFSININCNIKQNTYYIFSFSASREEEGRQQVCWGLQG